MRVLPFTSPDYLNDPPELHAPALVNKHCVWNALISMLKLNINYNQKTKYLTGSRTLGTSILCAIASARRLCGN